MSPNFIDSTSKITVISLSFSPFPLLVPHFWPNHSLHHQFLPMLSVPSRVVSTQQSDDTTPLLIHIFWFSVASKFRPNSPVGSQDPFKFPVAFSRFIFNHLFSCLSCPGDAESFTAPRKAHDLLRPQNILLTSPFGQFPLIILKEAQILPCLWGFFLTSSELLFLFHIPFAHSFIHPHIEIQALKNARKWQVSPSIWFVRGCAEMYKKMTIRRE